MDCQPSDDYELIDTQDALERMAASLNGVRMLAVDLEADSMYHFKEKICLLQLFDGFHVFLVDPLQAKDLSPLKPVFAAKNVVKVLHGADYDIRSLYRDFKIEVQNLFDTQIASRFLGMKETGLDAVVQETLDIRLDKNFQKKDWSQRPLPRKMLQYAVKDVLYLHRVMEILESRLREKRRITWAKEECNLLRKVRCPETGNEPLFLRFKGAGRMDRKSLCILEALLQYRKKVAEKKDKPLFKVLSSKSLTRLAATRPLNFKDIKDANAISPKQLAMYGQDLVDVIREASSTPKERYPIYPRKKKSRLSPVSPSRFKRLKQWRDEKAESIQLEAPIICNKALLTEIASKNPKSPDDLKNIHEMRNWQRRAFGREILLALHHNINP